MVKSTAASLWWSLRRYYKGLIREEPEVHPTLPTGGLPARNTAGWGQPTMRYARSPTLAVPLENSATSVFVSKLKHPEPPILSVHHRALAISGKKGRDAIVTQGDCVPPVLERRSRLPRSPQRAAQERQPFQIEARDLLRPRFSLVAAQLAQPRLPITGLPGCTRVTMTLDKGVP